MWYVVLPVVLIAFLVATTIGMVWHHHAGSTADKCTLCHLAIAPFAPGPGVRGIVLDEAHLVPGKDRFHSHLVADEMPARAPPVQTLP
jgi:hypothetical protein